MNQLIPNKDNTAFFEKDYCRLLLILIKFELMLRDPELKYFEKYTYKHQIWTTEEGWYLTFQTYNRETNKPCIIE